MIQHHNIVRVQAEATSLYFPISNYMSVIKIGARYAFLCLSRISHKTYDI